MIKAQLSGICQGVGPNGRIIARDIEKGARAEVDDTKSSYDIRKLNFTNSRLSNVRKLIAKAMHSSLQNSAQLTHHMSADVRSPAGGKTKNQNQTCNG